MKEKIIIGRKDKADLPDIGFTDVPIKMDTGAFTSAIHCRKIEVRLVNNKQILFYTLLDPSHEQYNKKELSTEIFKEKLIKNSFGHSEKRYVIETRIKLFSKFFPIELSLSERGEMKFPILIGRRFLIGKFIVDSARYDLSYKRKMRKLNKTHKK